MADNIITALETDSEFQELIRKYESPNFFSILGSDLSMANLSLFSQREPVTSYV